MIGSIRVEHVVLAAAGAALVVLVVLPLAFLLWGSLSADGRLSLDHFREALGSRLYAARTRYIVRSERRYRPSSSRVA